MNFNYLIECRIRDLPTCSMDPQPPRYCIARRVHVPTDLYEAVMLLRWSPIAGVNLGADTDYPV
jgi:hypothetical protein